MRLIGDVPIYVAPGSADHAAHPELFQTGVVAGAPPDAFTDNGQLWGNPLYDWPALQRRGYRWWIERLRRIFELFDLARIDHFRGFVAYWAVPGGRDRALRARWQRGPGAAPFRAAARAGRRAAADRRGPRRDHPAGAAAARRARLPGMVVLQFGFDPGDAPTPHRLANHREHPSSTRAPTTTTRSRLVGWGAGGGREEARRGWRPPASGRASRTGC